MTLNKRHMKKKARKRRSVIREPHLSIYPLPRGSLGSFTEPMIDELERLFTYKIKGSSRKNIH